MMAKFVLWFEAELREENIKSESFEETLPSFITNKVNNSFWEHFFFL